MEEVDNSESQALEIADQKDKLHDFQSFFNMLLRARPFFSRIPLELSESGLYVPTRKDLEQDHDANPAGEGRYELGLAHRSSEPLSFDYDKPFIPIGDSPDDTATEQLVLASVREMVERAGTFMELPGLGLNNLADNWLTITETPRVN